MEKQTGKLQARATIIAAIIAAAATAFAAILQFQKMETEGYFCENIKLRSEIFKNEIAEKMVSINNDREEINHLFWKQEFEKISRYDCAEIKSNFDEIMKSFEKASKQLNL